MMTGSAAPSGETAANSMVRLVADSLRSWVTDMTTAVHA